MEKVVELTFNEIQSLFDFANRYKDVLNDGDIIKVSQTQTGIGTATKVFISTSDTDEDEGLYKDITDYESW